MRSLKLGLVAATMLLGTTALTAPAFADSTHTCQGNADCSNTTNNTTNNNTSNKGIGVGVGVGYGEGGDAKAYGGDANAVNFNANVAKGGDATNYNKNDNKDFNANVNLNKDYNKNTNKNYNTDINHNSNKQGQGQLQGQQQGQQQGQSQAVQNVGNVHIENERPPVNTAYSAALATSEDTCMGSSSIGGQAVSFGLTIGTTWTDDNCQRLKNSRQLVALGYHRAATSLICFDESVAEAMNRAGTPCPNGAAVYVAPPPVYVPPPQYRMAPIYDAPPPVKRKRKKVLPPK